MTVQTEATTEARIPLTRERVLRAAIELADDAGIEAVSMRKIGQHLGVEAMSLYNHVKNKDEILDGMVELIVDEIDLSAGDEDDWKAAVRNRILSARRTMLKHRWAPTVMETRTEIGMGIMVYFNGLIGLLRRGGLSYDLVHHALHTLGSRSLGFTQELFEPDDEAAASADIGQMMTQMADQFPFVVEMLGEISHDDGPEQTMGWCDDQTEFIFALDLILDGLETLRDAE